MFLVYHSGACYATSRATQSNIPPLMPAPFRWFVSGCGRRRLAQQRDPEGRKGMRFVDQQRYELERLAAEQRLDQKQ
ncbi:MAG: hypothetical protein OHK0015_07910 [Chloroflexi bacterium OHK40]